MEARPLALPAGTNYPMWVPYQSGDTNMRFRFVVQLEPQPAVEERAGNVEAAAAVA